MNTLKFNKAASRLNAAMRKARKEYVDTMKYEDSTHLEFEGISYTRIPGTDSYVEIYDNGIIKTTKYGAFVIDISGRHYVEIDYGYVNKEISYVNDEYVKNSEIKFVG